MNDEPQLNYSVKYLKTHKHAAGQYMEANRISQSEPWPWSNRMKIKAAENSC